MRVCMAIFLALVMGACSAQDQLNTFPGLSNAVSNYYRDEQNHDWQKTYEWRTPGFKQNVLLPTYIESMRRDSQGWVLKTFTVLGAKEEHGKIEVMMRFVEQVPKGYMDSAMKLIGKPNSMAPAEISLTDTSIWMRVHGQWYCYDAASRTHLSMNNPVVAE